MSEEQKDEIIKAQRTAIGILFEIIKRYQANSELDQEYLELLGSPGRSEERIEQITKERKVNADVIGRLLGQLNE